MLMATGFWVSGFLGLWASGAPLGCAGYRHSCALMRLVRGQWTQYIHGTYVDGPTDVAAPTMTVSAKADSGPDTDSKAQTRLFRLQAPDVFLPLVRGLPTPLCRRMQMQHGAEQI